MQRQEIINTFSAPTREEELYDNLIDNLLSVEERYNTYWAPFDDPEYSTLTIEETNNHDLELEGTNNNLEINCKDFLNLEIESKINYDKEKEISYKLTAEFSSYFVCGIEYKISHLKKKTEKKAIKKKIKIKSNFMCSFCHNTCKYLSGNRRSCQTHVKHLTKEEKRKRIHIDSEKNCRKCGYYDKTPRIKYNIKLLCNTCSSQLRKK